MAVPASSMDAKVEAMFHKVSSKTITREEGALLLNDLVKQSADKGALLRIIRDFCQKPPSDVLVKTIFHTVALANNPEFEPILEASLDHDNEEVSFVSAEGLARFRSDKAKNALVRNLDNAVYHVRKASGDVLIRGWGKEGISLVVTHGLSHPDLYVRETAASRLAGNGKRGISALIDVMETNNLDAIHSAAEALIEAGISSAEKDQVKKIIHALTLADSGRQSATVITLMNLLSVLQESVEGFEEYIAAFLSHDAELVRQAARRTLASLATKRAGELISSPLKQHRIQGYLTEEEDDGL
jgi:HEAT repeat protein